MTSCERMPETCTLGVLVMRGSETPEKPRECEDASRFHESRAFSEIMSESEYSFVIVRLNTRCSVVVC